MTCMLLKDVFVRSIPTITSYARRSVSNCKYCETEVFSISFLEVITDYALRARLERLPLEPAQTRSRIVGRAHPRPEAPADSHHSRKYEWERGFQASIAPVRRARQR